MEASKKKGPNGLSAEDTKAVIEERLKAVRSMIMADSAEQRTEALDKLLPYQRADFEGIFRAMEVRVWVCGCGLVG